jgi:hypothetical protein
MLPAPITVEAWMVQLGFTNQTKLFIKQLGAHTGQTGNGKPVHLTMYKSNLPEQIPFSTAAEALDELFPADGDKGFHISIEMEPGTTGLKNPHIYRGVNDIYKGQGNNLMPDEWAQLRNSLKKRLDDEIKKLKSAIVATKWCKS